MDTARKINILISTYNGEKYLAELLESLLDQSYKNFRVLIRDDNSVDDSINIINKYTTNYSGTFRLFQDSLGNIGAANSFMNLLQSLKELISAWAFLFDLLNYKKFIPSINEKILFFDFSLFFLFQLCSNSPSSFSSNSQ